MTYELLPPSCAVSVRVEHRPLKRAEGQRRHDLRRGPQPSYVDMARVQFNSVILEPRPPSELRRLCEERRANRTTRRAMKSDAAVATHMIVTFGRGAQATFEALPVEVQDQAIRAVAEAAASLLGVELTGLVVHRDESAIHAHAQMPAVRPDGVPLSKGMTRAVGARLQDVAAEAISPFAPAIVRGERKADRIARGDAALRIIHRSVRELHQDLPRELEEARTRVEEMVARVFALQEKATLTERELKRLETYQRRLDDRRRELAEVEERLDAVRGEADRAVTQRAEDEELAAEAMDAARQEAARIVAEAQEEAETVRDTAHAEGLLQGRAEAAVELRAVHRELFDVRQGFFDWLDASTDVGLRKEGTGWVRRLDGLLQRLRSWVRGSASGGLHQELREEEPEEVGPGL